MIARHDVQFLTDMLTIAGLVNPETPDATTATIALHFQGSSPVNFTLTIESGHVRLMKGAPEKAFLTIETTPAVWRQLSRGEIDASQAGRSGLLRIQGELHPLQSLNHLMTRQPATDC